MVAGVETGSESSPPARPAREALEQLSEDEGSVRYPLLPRWFFVVPAAAVAGLHRAQLLAPSDAAKATFAVAVASAVLGLRYWLNHDGVAWVSVRPADVVPFLAAVLGTFVLCLVASATTGAWWIWVVGAVVAGGVVLRTGNTYRRVFGNAG